MTSLGSSSTWHALDLEQRPIDVPRSLKAIVVGAGISGINAAILLPAKVPGLDLRIFERDTDLVCYFFYS